MLTKSQNSEEWWYLGGTGGGVAFLRGSRFSVDFAGAIVDCHQQPPQVNTLVVKRYEMGVNRYEILGVQ